jgi:hypothetical protein
MSVGKAQGTPYCATFNLEFRFQITHLLSLAYRRLAYKYALDAKEQGLLQSFISFPLYLSRRVANLEYNVPSVRENPSLHLYHCPNALSYRRRKWDSRRLRVRNEL